MGDENPIRTLEDYSKPSHEGYINTIKLPIENNVVPLRSDTIRLVQNGCSFHGLWSEDPNQHIKDFLKLVNSLDLDGSITTLEDLTTRFLAQFFPPGRTAKLSNDILMFQQHHGESLSEAWTRFKDLLQKVPHHGIDRWLQIQIFYDHPQALGTTFEARVRDYMAAHTERIERFENAIFKQREEINDRMTEMFRLLKELTISIAPKKEEEDKSNKCNVATDDDSEKTNGPILEVSVKEDETKNGAENKAKNKPIKKLEKEVVEAPSSQPVEYYLKHRINEKLIEGLVDNNRFNDSLSRVQLGKTKGKTYNMSPRGPVYEAILKKKITKKEDIRGNFEIPCNIGGLKHVNALVDQGSDVNVMPYSTYMKLTDERPAETNIRLFLASHSYIYSLGIAKDVLVDVAGYVYPVDFVILDIKEDEKRPFILGTPFLTTAKAVIKFNKGTITLKSGKSKISFYRIPESPCKSEKGIKKDIEPIAPIITVNRLVLEWEEKIKLHQEKEMEFNRWRNKNFKNERHALVKIGDEKDDEREVTKFIIKNEEEIFTNAGDDVRIYPDGVASPVM
ncbi:MAK10-like protein [Tanacetum coccineum]